VKRSHEETNAPHTLKSSLGSARSQVKLEYSTYSRNADGLGFQIFSLCNFFRTEVISISF